MGNQASVGLTDGDQLDNIAEMPERAKAGTGATSSSSSGGNASGNETKYEAQEEGGDLNPVELLFQFIPYYGQGDDANDSIVRGTLAGLPMQEVDTKDEYGNTLLLLACQYSCEDLVRIMLKKGANPNALNSSGACCLHFSCYKESASKAVAKALLANGATPEMKETTYGCTPLHYAAGTGDVDLIKMLIAHGAQLETKDYYDYTCQDYAREAECVEAEEYFKGQLRSLGTKKASFMSPGSKGHNGSFPFGSPLPSDQYPPGWEPHIDPDSGGRYFINSTTHETLWESDLKLRYSGGGGVGTPGAVPSTPQAPPTPKAAATPVGPATPVTPARVAMALPTADNSQVNDWANSQATRVRLIALLGKHDPMRLMEVDAMLKEHKGKEGDMFADLCEEFKVEEDPEFASLARKPVVAVEEASYVGDLLGGVPPAAAAPAVAPSGLPQMDNSAAITKFVLEAQTKFDKELSDETTSNDMALAAKDKDIKGLQDEVDALSMERADLDDSRAELSDELEGSSAEDVETRNVENAVNDLQKKNRAAKDEITKGKEDITNLTDKVASITASLSQMGGSAEERAAACKKAEEDRRTQDKERSEKHECDMVKAEESGKNTVERVRKELERVRAERAKAATDAVTAMETLKTTKEKEIADLAADLESSKATFDTEIKDAKEATAKAGQMTKDCSSEAVKAEDEIQALQSDVVAARSVMQVNMQLHKDLHREQQARRRLHNELEEMKGKVRIMVRIRPLAKAEFDRGDQEAVSQDGKLSVLVRLQDTKKMYDFDTVHGGSGAKDGNNQTDIFAVHKNLITSVADGFNIGIVTYGHTGAGKTFTMLGAQDDIKSMVKANGDLDKGSGMAIRGVAELFRLLHERHAAFNYEVSVSMVQIYKEKMTDLLFTGQSEVANGDEPPAEATEVPAPELEVVLPSGDSAVVEVKGAVMRSAENPLDVLSIFEEGSARSKVNAARSHLIVRLQVSCINRRTGVTTTSCLSLADLAGSERVDKASGADNDAIKEGISVATSLKAFGDCVGAVSSGAQRVPHKGHPLTMLLADCLSNDSKLVLIVNTSATDLEAVESNASLNFANKCKDCAGAGGLAPAVQAQQLNALKKELAKLKKGGGPKKAGLARPG